jgi:hypothetical protein
MDYIELMLAATVPIAIVAFVGYRALTKKGMGISATRALAFTTMTPIVAILLLRHALDSGTVGAIYGAMVGFLFSNSPLETGKKSKGAATTGD